MGVSDDFVTESIDNTNTFITTHKKKIPYFNYSNPVKHFYDQTTQTCNTLIVRNKNRLVKEIIQSKELMVLLAYSTTKRSGCKRKEKSKKTAFGYLQNDSITNHLFTSWRKFIITYFNQFIPTLLPSAFNENLDENE